MVNTYINICNFQIAFTISRYNLYRVSLRSITYFYRKWIYYYIFFFARQQYRVCEMYVHVKNKSDSIDQSDFNIIRKITYRSYSPFWITELLSWSNYFTHEQPIFYPQLPPDHLQTKFATFNRIIMHTIPLFLHDFSSLFFREESSSLLHYLYKYYN